MTWATWHCLTCPTGGGATGVTADLVDEINRHAEEHTKATGHATLTSTKPSCPDCGMEVIRSAGRDVRVALHPCAAHRDTPPDNGTGRTSTKGGTLPGR